MRDCVRRCDLKPDFQIRVCKYTYANGPGEDIIFLHSPLTSDNKSQDTIVLRQINSTAENKVWLQDHPLQHLKKCDQEEEETLIDYAHGVILRNGETRDLLGPGASGVFHEYHRGDRIWVERSLVPTRNIKEDENKIPVVDLDSLKVFEIPYDYICFVPQLELDQGSEKHYASLVGPVLDTFQGKRKLKSCIYFMWPETRPTEVSFTWLNMKDKLDLKLAKTFNKIQDAAHRQRIFEEQWSAQTKKLAKLGLLLGDEIVEGTVDQSETSSEGSTESLALDWGPLDHAPDRCCNLDPCPAKFSSELDLVPTYIGGYRMVEHYHVQDDDLDECPGGAEHKGHCVLRDLRDNRARCAYSVDRARHTCCKLRTNPLLPGPHADPGDPVVPLWETMASAEYFVDVSANVQTRNELADRDEIPPEVKRLHQQFIADEGDS